MKLKYAIFDMDGTLLDSMHIWDNFCTNYVKWLGLELKPGFIDKYYTMKPLEGAQFFVSEYNLDKSPEELQEEINRLVLVHYLDEVVPKSGVVELLSALKMRGVKMAVATLTDKEVVEAILEKYNMKDYFSVIRTSTEAGKSKKFPDIYNQCTELLGGTVSETAVFEDSLLAIQTARNAGYFVVGLADSSNVDVRDEVKSNASVYFDSLEHFPVQDYFI